LQKLMLRSRSNARVAVRRVMEINAGRKTAGVDGSRSRRLIWSTGCNTVLCRGHRGRSSGCMCPKATGASSPGDTSDCRQVPTGADGQCAGA
jgi:hypothetical protein